jgi:hypothetical protein
VRVEHGEVEEDALDPIVGLGLVKIVEMSLRPVVLMLLNGPKSKSKSSFLPRSRISLSSRMCSTEFSFTCEGGAPKDIELLTGAADGHGHRDGEKENEDDADEQGAQHRSEHELEELSHGRDRGSLTGRK